MFPCSLSFLYRIKKSLVIWLVLKSQNQEQERFHFHQSLSNTREVKSKLTGREVIVLSTCVVLCLFNVHSASPGFFYTQPFALFRLMFADLWFCKWKRSCQGKYSKQQMKTNVSRPVLENADTFFFVCFKRALLREIL